MGASSRVCYATARGRYFAFALITSLVLALGVVVGLSSCSPGDSASTGGSTTLEATADTSSGSATSKSSIAAKDTYGLSEAITSGDYGIWFYGGGVKDLSYKTGISHTLVFDGLDYTCYITPSSYDQYTLQDIDGLSDDEIVGLAEERASSTVRGSVDFIYTRDPSGNSLSWEYIRGLPMGIGSSTFAYSTIPINGAFHHVLKYDSNMPATTILSHQYFGIKQQVNYSSYPLFTRSKTATAPTLTKDSLDAEGLVDYDTLGKFA